MTVENKNCIVTGGANGIGRCIAEEFIKTGARVFVIDTDAEAGEIMQDRYPGRFFFFAGDIADQKTIDDFIAAVIEKSAGTDVLINNAAVSPGWIETAMHHIPPRAPEHSEADEKQHPAGRAGVPEDIAAMVLFLCSDKAGFITGQDFVVDGGMSKNMIFNGDWNWSYTPPGK